MPRRSAAEMAPSRHRPEKTSSSTTGSPRALRPAMSKTGAGGHASFL